MKFTLSWLKNHLETDKSLPELLVGLTDIGLEVEGVEDKAAAFAPFRVAYVETADKHPDADRLKVCIVDTGSEKIQVVCGAPNARAGMKGVFAPDGSLIPGTGTVLKKGMIRGQASNGMLVSEKEMGLSDNHDGIIEVGADVPLGTPFATLMGLDDPVIEIKLTPNRGDCAGVHGIARDLAAAGYGRLKDLPASPVKGAFESPIKVQLKFDAEAQDACSLFIGCYIKGVKNGPSPDWLQKRLTSVGLRPISTLVDITNLMTIGVNRPLHVFDADKIKGDLHVRLARDGETLAALNDKEYTLTKTMTAVCDDSGVLGLGGIIGGASTGCSDDTVNVFVEAAYFDPLRTARTGRALSLDTDARYRFERGIDPAFTRHGIEIAVQMIIDLCGGTPSNIVVAGNGPAWQRTINFRPERVQTLGGANVDEATQKKILSVLGFGVAGSGATWQITPPSWRSDIEGEADIVEEITRIHGFDKIAAVSVRPDYAVTRSAETVTGALMRKSRAALARRGLHECITYSFMHHDHANLFGANDDTSLRLSNPISNDLDQMRPSALPNLLQAAQRNADRGNHHAALFEVGPIFASVKPAGQKMVACGIRHKNVGDKHWSGAQASRTVDVFDAKADALAILESCVGLSADKAQISRDAPAHYHPGRSGTLRQGPVVLGYFGEIHPGVLDALKIDGPAVGFEMFLQNLPAPKTKGTAKSALKLEPLQSVTRDFAFMMDANVEADMIIKAARGVDKALITDVNVFDVYQGKGVEPGKKSLAFTVHLQPVEKTMTDVEIDALAKKVVDAVIAKTGGTLRS
jgi:phenylalanyl-tRNA synthetase beta chain